MEGSGFSTSLVPSPRRLPLFKLVCRKSLLGKLVSRTACRRCQTLKDSMAAFFPPLLYCHNWRTLVDFFFFFKAWWSYDLSCNQFIWQVYNGCIIPGSLALGVSCEVAEWVTQSLIGADLEVCPLLHIRSSSWGGDGQATDEVQEWYPSESAGHTDVAVTARPPNIRRAEISISWLCCVGTIGGVSARLEWHSQLQQFEESPDSGRRS